MADEDKTFEFDPKTGLPRRVPASERRRVQVPDPNPPKAEETRSKGGKSPAKRAPSKAKAERTPSGGVQTTPVAPPAAPPLSITVSELPGGGTVTLMNIGEVNYFETIKSRYLDEFPLTKPNDLSRMSQLIMAELTAYRLMQDAAGQRAQYDAAGNLIGLAVVDPIERDFAMTNLPKVQDEIRKLENALRIDKKTREGSGQHEVKNYIENLKSAAAEYGVHLSERYTYYDETMNELSWMLRVLDNADKEDRDYHKVSEEGILKYVRERLSAKEQMDIDFAKAKQSVWVGSI